MGSTGIAIIAERFAILVACASSVAMCEMRRQGILADRDRVEVGGVPGGQVADLNLRVPSWGHRWAQKQETGEECQSHTD
jgi:hypothetical protein